MQFCLELRASGASYSQIGKSLSPSVSKQRAFRIVQKALDGLIQQCSETAERVRQLELYRLDRMRLALDPKKFDPRVADTLIRISERVAKLHGLDAPQPIQASASDLGPIEAQEPPPDYSKLTLEELLQLEALYKKAHGLPPGTPGVINEDGPYTRKWYALQRASETLSSDAPHNHALTVNRD
jgi:hypothetical protein